MLCVWFDCICLNGIAIKPWSLNIYEKVEAPQPVNGRSDIREIALFQIIILGELKVRSISEYFVNVAGSRFINELNSIEFGIKKIIMNNVNENIQIK